MLAFAQVSFAQLSPDTLWTHTYGGSSPDYAYFIQQTADGGYIVAGYTYSFGAGSSDFYLVKTNSQGDTLWTRTYGGSDYDVAYSVQQTADGGYIVAGETRSFGAGERDFYVVKTNPLGDTLWTRTYGGSSDDYAHSVQRTADGGYVVAGETSSFGAGNWDFYFVKTNLLGDTLWTRTYGGSSDDYARSVQQTSDGGYIVAGTTNSFGAGYIDFYVVKTNPLGDTLWTRTYGGSDEDFANSVQQTADGGYIVAGSTYPFGADETDFYVVKTNSQGDTLWTRTYGGSNADDAYSVLQATDGGYVMAGRTLSFGAGNNNFYVVRTNSQGDTLWTRTYGGNSDDFAYSVQQTADGGHVVAGSTYSFGAGEWDFYVVKTGPESFGQLSGPLSGTLGPGTYHIVGDISIQSSDTLTLMPGTVFHFDSLYGFYINGTLMAEGTESDSIVFTTDTTANPSRWHGLRFDGSGSTGSRLAYCLIEHGIAIGSAPDSWGGGVLCDGASPTFTHCTIRDNVAQFGGGVKCYSASASFTSCTISGNRATTYGGGIACIQNSSMILTDCTIENNSASDRGGGFFCYYSLPQLTNCTIRNNTAGSRGGGVGCSIEGSPICTSCLIENNQANYGGGVSCQDNSSPVLSNCTVSGNSANSYGGGVYCTGSSPTFEGCTISGNTSNLDGAGLGCYYTSSPTITNCLITGNVSNRHAGGLICDTDGSPTVTHCDISDNSAASNGGGLYCQDSEPNFFECTFSRNSSSSGGGIYCTRASPIFMNCTLSRNSAGNQWGGVYFYSSSPVFNSTIIAFSEGEGVFFRSSAESQFKYCDIFGNSAGNIVFDNNDPSQGPPGIGQLVTTNANDDSCDVFFNIGLNPMFVDTAANDYHLLAGSPCIDAGDPALLPDPDYTVVEIGAFYFPQQAVAFFVTPDSLDFGAVLYREDSTLSFWIHNLGQNTLYAAGIRATDTLIFRANPASAQIPPMNSVEIELTFTPRRNISYLDSVQISFAALDEVHTVVVQGTGFYDCHVLEGELSGILSMDCNPYYVAAAITLAEDSTLAIEAGVEIIFDCHCQFIVNGLLSATGTEQDSIRFTCDAAFNPDRWGGIRFVSAHDSCRLEYCVIEKGRAEGAWPDYAGGGIYFDASSPTFAHSIIRDNWSESDGGGVHCRNGSSLTFVHCAISNNSSDRYGGGVYCSGSSPTFADCIIRGNSASGNGGGMHCSSSSPTFANSAISDNSAGNYGGGIDLYDYSSRPTFAHCVISGNMAISYGGGMHCGGAAPSLDSCTISDNTGSQGGGMFCSSSSAALSHCVINGNTAGYAAGVFCASSLDTFTNCTFTGNSAANDGGGVYCRDASSVFNSTIISFSNGDGIYFRNSSASVFKYCDVFGNSDGDIIFRDGDPSNGPAGIGNLTTTNANGDSCDLYYNIFLNPMFVDTAASDYHLLAGSFCIDAADPILPLDPDGTITDIGAFYFQNNAPSPFDLLSPANGDTVDTLEVTLMWAASNDPDPGDSIVFYRAYVALDSAFTTELDSETVNASELEWDDLVDGQTYWWRVKAFDTQGNGTFSNQTWNFTSVVSAISGDKVLLPTEYALHQNYPNPFNPTTVIRYDVPVTGKVSLAIFNLLGQRVTTLLDQRQAAGTHTIQWDAADWPSGVYLCRMEAAGFVQTRKMLLVK
jgi:uncharacterized delta-60 repeat protein